MSIAREPLQAWTMIRPASILSAIAAALLVSGCATTSSPSPAPAAAAPPNMAEQRAASAQLEPMARAAFWSAEYERNPADPQAALEFARSLRMIGSADRAAMVASQALAQRPNDIDLLLVLASARLDEGRPPAAIEPLERAIATAPSDWRPYSLLGVMLDQMARHEEARGRYRQALEIAPGNPAVLTNLGMSYAITGDAETAERLLREAMAQPGAGPQARQNLALVIAYQGRFDEAEQLALVDLPVGVARNNIDYARAVLTQNRRWDDLRR